MPGRARPMRLVLLLASFGRVALRHRTAHSTQGDRISKAPDLLVLVRGCAYHYNLHRFGPTNARRLDRRIEGEQAAAIRSIRPSVLKPLERKGWNLHLAFDITNCSWPVTADGVSGDGGARLSREAIALGRGVERGERQVRFRIRPESGAGFRSAQVGGCLDSLEWATAQRRIQNYWATLILRIDMLFKAELPLPSPAESMRSSAVRIFSATWQRDDLLPGGTLRANDVIFWIPGTAALAAFKSVLLSTANVNDMHLISSSLDVGTLFFSQHDSDSQHDWNSVYSLIGRPASPTIPKYDRVHFTRRAAAAASSVRWGAWQVPGYHEPLYTVSREDGRDRLDGLPTLRVEISLPFSAPLSPFHSDAGVEVRSTSQLAACEMRFISPSTGHLLRLPLDRPVNADRVEVRWVTLASGHTNVSSVVTIRAQWLPESGQSTARCPATAVSWKRESAPSNTPMPEMHGSPRLHAQQSQQAGDEHHQQWRTPATARKPEAEIGGEPLSSTVSAYLHKFVSDQLTPFHAGITAELVQQAYDSARMRVAYKGDDYMRIRIVNNSLYLAKRGRCFHYRHSAVMQGLLRMLAEAPLPDVDFVFSVSDHPPCDGFDHPDSRKTGGPAGSERAHGRVSLPIAALSTRQGCRDLVLPCWSMMHDGYQDPLSTHPYSYHRLASLRKTSPFDRRLRRLWWDMTPKPSNNSRGEALSALQRAIPPFSLPLSFPTARVNIVNDAREAGADGPLEAARYQFGSHMEGVTYSMRLKNVLLLGSLAVWLGRPPPLRVYREYWYGLLEPLNDFIWSFNPSSVAPLPRAPHHRDARRMAERASDLAAHVLRPSAIRQYVRLLLTSYAKLQTFAPAALPRSGFLHVTRHSINRICKCAGGECFDAYLRIWSSQGVEPPKMSTRPLVSPRPNIDCLNTSIPRSPELVTLLRKWCTCTPLRGAKPKANAHRPSTRKGDGDESDGASDWPRGVCVWKNE